MTEKKRILLVDDEPPITRSLALYLEGTGRYEVKTENESLEALRTARMFQPHMIFLDVSMPDLDGGELAGIMQKDEALVGVPIVFLTALVRSEEVEIIGKQIAGRPYLAKPADPEKVIACIEEHTS